MLWVVMMRFCYQLPKHIDVHWFDHMDHSLKPFKDARLSQIQAIENSVLELEKWAKHTLISAKFSV